MHPDLKQSIDAVRQHHRNELATAIAGTSRKLKDLLRLNEHHQHGHEEESLHRAFGSIGSGSLNLSALSHVLDKSIQHRTLPGERIRRIESFLSFFESIDLDFLLSDDSSLISFSAELDQIREKAENHLRRMTQVFSYLRASQLEIRSKFDPAIHAEPSERTEWFQLSPAELSICPPLVVLAYAESSQGPQLHKILTLLEDRRPLKIVLTRSGLPRDYPPNPDGQLAPALTLETLPVALRGVYFLQTVPSLPGFAENLFSALASPRPALISILGPRDQENPEAFARRAQRALQARAFPAIRYDPDRASGFVSCFDLSDNPSPEQQWPMTRETAPGEIPDPYTFAHFAVTEPEFKEDFKSPPADLREQALVPICQFLELTRRQRLGKFPTVALPLSDGSWSVQIASPAIVTQTADCIHLWTTLQEIAGLNNPHIHATRRDLESGFEIRFEDLRQALMEEFEKKQTSRDKSVTAAAVQKMVTHLTGIPASQIDLSQFSE